jgi:Peptidyl-tRNA hydrolase PTH2
VQSIHAAMQFAFEHPEVNKVWYENSNYLGFLSVANENELMELAEQAVANDIHVSIFREPDVDNEVTAIAIAPGPKSKKLVSKLDLALKDK